MRKLSKTTMQARSALVMLPPAPQTPDEDGTFSADLVAHLGTKHTSLTHFGAQDVVDQPATIRFVEVASFAPPLDLDLTADLDVSLAVDTVPRPLSFATAAPTATLAAPDSILASPSFNARTRSPDMSPHCMSLTRSPAACHFSRFATPLTSPLFAHTPGCDRHNIPPDLCDAPMPSAATPGPSTPSPEWTEVRSSHTSHPLPSLTPALTLSFHGATSSHSITASVLLRLRGTGDHTPHPNPDPRPRDALDYWLPPVEPPPPRDPRDDGSLGTALALRCESMGAAAASVGTDRSLTCAHLHFHDGSSIVISPGTSRFILGSSSLPFLPKLPSDCRRCIEPRHISLSFHDDVLVASALCQSSGLAYGPYVLRADGERVPLPRTPHPLTSGDTLFLAFYLGHGIAPITFRFACPPQTSALDDTSLSARLSLAERALRVSEVERSRLQREVEELRMALTHTDNVLATNLARTTDALERRRVREDGIFCSCCAMLRLPDSFFPSILAAGTPPANRRCALCIQHIRTHHDLFGRPFFVPSGYSMPEPHRDDLKRLTQLIRCVSCARMRHSSLFRPPNPYDSSLPRPMAYDCLKTCPTRLTKPVSREATRSYTRQPVCTYCRRDLLTSSSLPASSTSHPLPLDARDTTQWEPDPDEPDDEGELDDPDDPNDPPDDPFSFDDMRHELY